MLAFLRVSGFAIIDKLDVEFKDGLNVITGETGAGKSIIINALSTLLNAKAPADAVRGASEQAEVVGHCFRDGEEYILRRTIGSQGRARAFVNESAVTVKKLEEVGDLLIHVYGQNESQQLLGKEHYISIIDRFLGLETQTEELSGKVRRLDAVGRELEAKKKAAESQANEAELLAYQIQEIEEARVGVGEEEGIRDRLKVLKDAARIRGGIEAVERGLYEDEQSVYATVSALSAQLRPFSGIGWVEAIKAKLDALSFDVEDVIASIREKEKSLDYEPGELEAMEERLSDIVRLKDKYAKTYGSIKEFEERARKRLGELQHVKSDAAELESEKAALAARVDAMAGNLSESRKKSTAGIERLVMDELALLSMKGVRFSIEIADRGSIGENGRDEIEFMLSTNPGEPLRPLRRVASGGELSRIMLAVKKITGDAKERTLVFDEIDAGIGGRVAEVVGRRLRELSGRHQIICITHLPQIAVYGHHHFLVEKNQGRTSTRTSIRELAGPERTAEVARMLGGINITDKTLGQAEEMLENAQKGAS